MARKILLAWLLALAAVLPCARAATAATCPSLAPVSVAIADPGIGLVIDGQCRTAYAAAGTKIAVFSLASRTFETPIDVGAPTRLMDISPDGKTLYVITAADTGLYSQRDTAVSVFDIASRTKIARIAVPDAGTNGDNVANSVAVAADGTVYIGTAYSGSVADGGPGRLLRAAAPSYAVSQVQLDAVSAPVVLKASADRGTIALGYGDGYVRKYVSATATFSPSVYRGYGGGEVAVSDGGSTTLAQAGVDNAIVVLDAGMAIKGRIPHQGGYLTGLPLVIDPTGKTAYQSTGTGVNIVDLEQLKFLRTVGLPADLLDNMALGADGTLMVLRTRRGLVLTSAAGMAMPAPPRVQLAPAGGVTAPLPCNVAFTSPLQVNALGKLSQLVIDSQCKYVFATNQSLNEVDVFSVQTGALVTSIPVGAKPSALDTNANGTVLYVANTGETTISAIDLVTGGESNTFSVASRYGAESPYSLAVAGNGHVLFSITSTRLNTDSIMDLDPGTGAMRERATATTSPLWGARLKASPDRSVVGMVKESTNGFVRYDSATDSFASRQFKDYMSPFFAFDRTGATVFGGTTVLDAKFNRLATVWPTWQYFGVAVSPDGRTGYRVTNLGVEVADLARAQVVETLAVGATSATNLLDIPGPGRVAISGDGALLATVNDNGFALIRLTQAPPAPGNGSNTAGSGVAGTCAFDPATPLAVPSASTLSDLFIDDECRFVYAVNQDKNRIEVFSLQSRTWGDPIAVGAQPKRLDGSADGRALYVVNSGGSNISVVDLATGKEARRVQMPIGSYDDIPTSVAALRNGRVLVTMAGGWDSGVQAYFGRVLQYTPATGAVTRRDDLEPAINLRASGDRSVAGLLRYGGAAYTLAFTTAADSANLTSAPAGRATEVQMDGAGDRAVASGTVIDATPAARGVLQSAATPLGTALSPNGALAYRTTASGEIEVYSLLTAAKTNLGIALGATLNSSWNPDAGRMAISRDGTLLAVVTNTGFSVVSTRRQAAPARVTAFGSIASAESFLRAHNTGAISGAVTVNLADPATGAALGSWTSPRVPGGGELQFSLQAIAAEALHGSQPGALYAATVQPDDAFIGYIQHVLWRPGDGTVTNLSTCGSGVSADPLQVSGVHSSAIGADYPSTIAINNTGRKATAVTLDVYDARDGSRLGSYVTGSIPSLGQLLLTVKQLEAGIGRTPAPGMYHYVIVARYFTGFLQHLVDNRIAGVVTDMTTTCSLQGAAPRPPVDFGAVSAVFSSAQGGALSFFRFTNTGTTAGRASVTLMAPSGSDVQSYRIWNSPMIAPGAALQVPVSTVESAGIGPAIAMPSYYNVLFSYDFTGTFQHVLWRPSDGTITNLSTCQRGPAVKPLRLDAVHSSLLSGAYPSSVIAANTGAAAMPVTLTVTDPRDGRQLGTYTSAPIPAGGAVVIDVAALQRAIGVTPTGDMYHYSVVADAGFTGFLQHLVNNVQAGVTTDMTTACNYR